MVRRVVYEMIYNNMDTGCNIAQCDTCNEIIWHYIDVIMSAMASQITGVSIVCLTVCSGADQRKHQSSASLLYDVKCNPVRYDTLRQMVIPEYLTSIPCYGIIYDMMILIRLINDMPWYLIRYDICYWITCYWYHKLWCMISYMIIETWMDMLPNKL